MNMCRIVCWILTVIVAVLSRSVSAQQELPVLRAESAVVDVQDGSRLRKGIWTVDPKVELDVFYAARSQKPGKITFISDVDRLSFDVEPNRTYDFVVLLGGKDRCRTRISTMVQPLQRTGTGDAAMPIAIPFDFSTGRIMVKAKVNGSEPLDLLFDTGADATIVHKSAGGKGVAMKFDGVQAHAGFGGTAVNQSASDNTIELAGLRWDHEPVIWSEHESFGGNGILGAHVFEDKIVEIDFDRKLLLIHDTLPEKASVMKRLPMRGVGRTFSIEVALSGGKTSGSGFAFVDTGLPGSLLVYPDLDRTLGLIGSLSRVGRSSTGGTGRGSVGCDIVVLPKLTLAGTTLRDIPIHVEVPGDVQGSSYSGAVLGMDVLKRFNLLLDYPGDGMYFASNTLLASPYEIVLPGPPWPMLGGAGAIAAAVGALLYRLTRKRKPAGAASDAKA